MTKGERRKQRQADHAARETARLSTGDTRNRVERQQDARHATASRARYARRRRHSRTPSDSLARADSYGGLIGGYETD